MQATLVQEAPAAATTTDREFYARNGYVPARKILDPAELPALREEYDRIVAKAAQELGGPNQNRRMLQVINAGEQSLIFRTLLHHPAIMAHLTNLIGPTVLLFHDQILYKPARDGGEVPWHQDNGYWRCQPATMASCWLALDDADADNGAMQVIPGSHLNPAGHQDTTPGARLLVTKVDDRAAVTVPVPAGWAMFHHCQTLHHTAPNHSPRDRRAFAIHGMAPGTTDRNGAVMHAGWSHPVLISA